MSKYNDLYIVRLFAFSKFNQFEHYEELASTEFIKALRSKYRRIPDDKFVEIMEELRDEIHRLGRDRVSNDFAGNPNNESAVCVFLAEMWKHFMFEGKVTLREMFECYIEL